MTRNDRQVPDGWQVVRLGDVAEVRKGLSFTKKGLVPGNVPVIAGGRGPAYFHNVSNRLGETITVSASGAHAGFVAFHRKPIFATDCTTVRAQSTISRTTFIYHALKHNEGMIYGRRSGSAQPHVYPRDIASFQILLPSVPEQQAIAAVLGSIDEAIERTEAVIAATERLRDALLHELLTRGVPGWHTEWKEMPGIGTIPADWEVVRLGDVLESTTYGTNASLNEVGATPVLRMNNLQNGTLDLSDIRRADLSKKESDYLNLVPGDILFNRTNSLILVGKVGIVRDLPQPISFASYLVRLRVREILANPLWLSALLWAPNYQSRIRRFATPGVSQANINPTSLKSLMIPLPSLPEQEIIAGVLDGVDTAIEQARNETNGLTFLKASAADALLTGRVRVAGRN